MKVERFIKCPTCDAVLPAKAKSCHCGWGIRGEALISREEIERRVEGYRRQSEQDWKKRATKIERQKEILLRAKVDKGDHKDWARRILALHDAGEKILHISLEMARDVLKKDGLKIDEGNNGCR